MPARFRARTASAPWLLPVAALAIGVGVALSAAVDNPAPFVIVPVLLLLLEGFRRASVRHLAHGMLFVALLLDNPTERPGRNLYRSPLYLPGTFLYETLSKSAHLPGFKLTGLQVFVLLIFSLIGLRALFGQRDGSYASTRPAAQPMMRACLASMAALVGLFVYGIGRGGATNYAIVQMQTMLFVPLMTVMFAQTFRSPRDARLLLNTLLTVGMLRALLCIYYWLTFMRHQGSDAGGQEGDGSYVTTHSDSILATVAVVICIARIYQQPRMRSLLLAGMFVPVVMLGIVANNRRIAFVAIALGLGFSYLAAGGPFKRRVHQTALVVLPMAVLYIAAGWSAHGAWAKPVQSLRSVIEQKDASSATRDIENYNLLQTLKQHPIMGSGFGHKYLELVQAYDISGIFEAYRYVPHNSILWIWGVGGVVGFSAYWMYISVGVYLAARVVRCGRSLHEKLVGMAAITAVCAYGAQSFGDMGLMSWMGGLIVSSCFGTVAAIAQHNGAWGTALVGNFDAEALAGGAPSVGALSGLDGAPIFDGPPGRAVAFSQAHPVRRTTQIGRTR